MFWFLIALTANYVAPAPTPAQIQKPPRVKLKPPRVFGQSLPTDSPLYLFFRSILEMKGIVLQNSQDAITLNISVTQSDRDYMTVTAIIDDGGSVTTHTFVCGPSTWNEMTRALSDKICASIMGTSTSYTDDILYVAEMPGKKYGLMVSQLTTGPADLCGFVEPQDQIHFISQSGKNSIIAHLASGKVVDVNLITGEATTLALPPYSWATTRKNNICWAHFDPLTKSATVSFAVKMNTQNPEKIWQGSYACSPSISPCGNQVAFLGAETDSQSLQVFIWDHGAIKKITSLDKKIMQIAWSPTDQSLAILTDEGENMFNISVIGTDGAILRTTPERIPNVSSIAWTADGWQILSCNGQLFITPILTMKTYKIPTVAPVAECIPLTTN